MRIPTLLVTLALATSAAFSATDPARSAFVDAIPGGWAGEATLSPMGPMPFAFVFETKEDGRVEAGTYLNSETWITLAFVKGADGQWFLDESGGLEGLGVQKHRLSPVPAPEPGVFRWATTSGEPSVRVDLARRGDALRIETWVRGQKHADFDLQRIDQEAARKLAARLAEARKRPPGPGRSIADLQQAPKPPAGEPQAIVDARAAAAAAPHDGAAQNAFARALIGAIDADQANGPRYAFELKATLERAVALDPPNPESYHLLAGYYLNAPPIAGGSIDKAAALADGLAAIDPAGAARIRAQVEARRAPVAQGSAR